ncbi:MAG: SusC/RagA family TonB-linked outer membrane protein [Muribaculaceae bacterium]|nr:SusC/RagA family TonB-linked outer membrane protein [Muribaculaceae bacterium]
MKKQLLLLLFSLFAVVGYARTVTGTVTSAADGEPLIGVTVMVKGGTGVATDFDGNYSVEVPDDNAVLNFSYVGMNPMSVTVGSRSVVDVQMSENSTVLEEVVVTAMGQVQEKKKLNFAVQALNSDEVTAGQSANFVNTLQGKVAGVQVGLAGGSPNSSSQIIVRAISSINSSQNNEPLFVIDGMPVRGGASSAADINPNDIETMSVLKGAAASALYGQEGANGVILITTKSGKQGTVSVTASGGWEISEVARTPKIQKKYIAGGSGIYVTNANGGFGPLLREEDTVYDNVGEFLGTGFMQKYDVSISGGNEKFSAYASANYMENEGVVHNDYRKRLGVYVKGDFNPSDKVKISLSTNYIDTKSRSFGNSMSTVYGWAINRDMSDYRLADGMPNWECRYDAWDELTAEQRLNAGTSPYYSLYMDDAEAQSTRVILNGQISYEPIKNLVFTGKIGYDKAHSMTESITHPRFYDEEFTAEEHDKFKQDLKDRLGTLDFSSSRSDRLTAQLTGNYYWKMNDLFNMNFFLGAEYSETNGLSSSLGGRDFILGGDFFALENLNPDWLFLKDLSLGHSHKNKFGYFGEIRFDYKGMAQLSVTGRVDDSSTLKQAIEPVYFYPSVTAGVIFSELFKLQNSWFDYGKIRGNWAKVGKDAPANLFNKSYKQWSTFPDGGFGVDATLSTASPTLEPEMTTSWEIGADLRFFKSRTRLDVAYYSTKVDNQIITMRVSPSSGMILQTFNSGQVENYGIEATLSQDILQTKDFTWTANLNFGLNRGRLRKLPGDQIEYLATQLSNDFYCAALVGGSTTTMVGKDYARTEDGDVLIDENGYPIISSNKNNHLGDREPDFLLGVGSTFTWKDLSLSFLVDGRCGGDVYNYTGRGLISNGQSHFWEKYRNRKVVFDGVVTNGDGTYRPNTTPVILDSQTSSVYFHGVTSNFIEDGSYIRLSYVTLSYDFGKLMKKLGAGNPIKGLRASLTGRNLLLLTKYTGADPQIMSGATSGIGTMGIDNYSIPSTRNFNLNVNVTF